jgi:hypothetical protein
MQAEAEVVLVAIVHLRELLVAALQQKPSYLLTQHNPIPLQLARAAQEILVLTKVDLDQILFFLLLLQVGAVEVVVKVVPVLQAVLAVVLMEQELLVLPEQQIRDMLVEEMLLVLSQAAVVAAVLVRLVLELRVLALVALVALVLHPL